MRSLSLGLIAITCTVSACGSPTKSDSPSSSGGDPFAATSPGTAVPPPRLARPADDVVGRAWIRRDLTLYERAYVECDQSAHSFSDDPDSLWRLRNTLTEDAR